MRISLIPPHLEEYDKKLIDFNKNVVPELLEVFEPLSREFNSSIFEYHIFFDDHSFFYISTDTKWHEYYIKNHSKSALAKEHIRRVFYENMKYYVISSNAIISNGSDLHNYFMSMNRFNIYNYFTIYIHYENYLEAFKFGTSNRNSSFINTCLNNISVLYTFIMHFRNRCGNIINVAHKSKKVNSKNGFLIQNNPSLSKQERRVENFLKSTEISRYPIMIDNEIKYLTHRQAQCVYYLAKGRTYKQIGRLLNIGERCVESHLQTAKLKLGCIDSSCIIKIFEQNDVLNKMLFRR